MSDFNMNPAPQAAPAPANPSVPAGNPNPAPAGGQPGVTPIPEGGDPKYYNAQTGEYNWRAEAIEHRFRQSQRQGNPAPNQPQNGNPANPSSTVDHNKLVEDLTRAVASGKDGLSERMAMLQAGIPETMVESYVQAVQVSQQARFNEAINYAGGPEKVNTMKQWVQQNLAPEERAQLNQQLNSGNWKMAIDYVNARMGSQANGQPNVDMVGGGQSQGAPFSSQQELAAAINKTDEQGRKLYYVDENYRRQVQQRVAVSRF